MFPLFGQGGMELLDCSHIVIVGLGGVGGYAAEALCRAGVGRITLVDGDAYETGNLNRQLCADTQTIGRNKAAVTAERIVRINPGCRAEAVAKMLSGDNCAEIIGSPSFVCDCCDDTDAKVEIAKYCVKNGISVISCMGTGNRLFPEKLKTADISKTSVCPLARTMRKKLREAGINHIPVVFSDEIPAVRSVPPSSVSFVPGVAGLMMAGYVIRKITGKEQ